MERAAHSIAWVTAGYFQEEMKYRAEMVDKSKKVECDAFPGVAHVLATYIFIIRLTADKNMELMRLLVIHFICLSLLEVILCG